MKTVKVTYTTKAEFSEQNQNNIQQVMTDLRQLKHHGIHYTACLSPDNKTFLHIAFFNSDDDQRVLNDLPSFKHFQEQLKLSGLEVPPKQELLQFIGASTTLFNI
jgi:hypothetical protein